MTTNQNDIDTKSLREFDDEHLEEAIDFCYKVATYNQNQYKGPLLVAERMRRESSRITKVSFWISVLALLISLFSLVMGVKGNVEDSKWGNLQAESLKALTTNSTESIEIMNSIQHTLQEWAQKSLRQKPPRPRRH